MQAVVLAAGKGTRMRSDIPKVLHVVLGKKILEHLLDSLKGAGAGSPFVVIGNGAGQVRSFLGGRSSVLRQRVVVQRSQRGTGHAVMMCQSALKPYQGDVLICPGDMPLLKPETIRQFIERHRKAGSQASILTSLRDNPMGYGRIVRYGRRVIAIREELDANVRERSIREVNTGVYLFNKKRLFEALKKIRPGNRKNELYLTDVIEVLRKEGCQPNAFPLASSDEGQGINDRKDLAMVAKLMIQREIQHHINKGVTVYCPEQTVISKGVKIGKDTVIYPWTYIESGVKIGRHCKIGPFAKIRSGSSIDDGSIIGSFVEVSRTKIGKKVLAKHLAYLGDATVGDGSNIGAGTITANFDGKRKHRTQIGKKNMIGSNTVFVAPVNLGNNVRTGAGAVLTGRKKIQSGQTMVGVPARPLKKRKKK